MNSKLYDAIKEILVDNLSEDVGLQTILNGINTVQNDKKPVLAQDLSAALARRGYIHIAAKVSLTTWGITGELGAFSQFRMYLLKKGFQPDTNVREITKQFADIIKGTDVNEHRSLKPDELHTVFPLVERLAACSAMNDMELLEKLIGMIADETKKPAYHIMQSYIGLYREIKSVEDVEYICRLRERLYEQAETMTRFNPGIAFIVKYLLSVSYARTYIDAFKEQTDMTISTCTSCNKNPNNNSYYQYEEYIDFDDIDTDADINVDIYDDGNDGDDDDEYMLCSEISVPMTAVCAFCKDRPIEDQRDAFIASIKECLNNYSFMPAARLFWDVHERYGMNYEYRKAVVSETAPIRETYAITQMPWLYLDSEFVEKT